MSAARIVAIGDSCLSMEFEPVIDPQVNARCITCAAAVEGLGLRGVRDVVPTYNAVTVHFDALVLDREVLRSALARISGAAGPAPAEGRVVEIPVAYGGGAAPDLPAVAAFAKCSEAQVIRLHSAREYRVFMLGFLPGFPYMGLVDPRIAMPRLETPRGRVAAGSVGIAGAQTGIYPCDSPGGWRIIGHTPVALYDPERADPFLLKAGDRVKFAAV